MRTSSSATSSAASGLASARIASLMPAGARDRRGARRRAQARARALLSDDDRSSTLLEVAGVQRLVVGRRVRVRDEDRGCPGRGELPDRAARARDGQIGDRERVAEVVRRREQDVVGTRDPRANASRSPARRRCAAPPGRAAPYVSAANSFSACAPARPPKTARTAPRRAGRSAARPDSRSPPRCARGIGRPTTRYFALSRPGTGYARKTRRANGAASRFASPRCASASVSAAGIPRSRAASTIGPAT